VGVAVPASVVGVIAARVATIRVPAGRIVAAVPAAQGRIAGAGGGRCGELGGGGDGDRVAVGLGAKRDAGQQVEVGVGS
jgi:hypothetical protein